jgi:hypothetical protein
MSYMLKSTLVFVTITITSCHSINNIGGLAFPPDATPIADAYHLVPIAINWTPRKIGSHSLLCAAELSLNERAFGGVKVDLVDNVPPIRQAHQFGGGGNFPSSNHRGLKRIQLSCNKWNAVHQVPASLLRLFRDPILKTMFVAYCPGDQGLPEHVILSLEGGTGEHGYAVAFVFYPKGFGFMVPPLRYQGLTSLRYSMKGVKDEK